jgi:molecular chaperone HtpG
MGPLKTDEYCFQAEIKQLMSLIIHSFYSNREIFLRELVSNAADAIDKQRHAKLSNKHTKNETDYRIYVTPEMDNKKLIIEDNGVGMTKQDLIDNLGTIAGSGTKAFIESHKKTKNTTDLIGQFGVGFYSAYLVAHEVEVTSVKDGEMHIWKSDACGSFTITELEPPKNIHAHGTKIVLNMKDDDNQYLEPMKIRDLLKRHTQFITHPIYIQTSPHEFVHINKDPPLWTRDPKSITKDEYNLFYKKLTNDRFDPIAYTHFSVEGTLEYKGIIYIPSTVPPDMFENHKPKSLKLFVRKIFVTDDSEHVVPDWLVFMKGIIDSNDLPLNISREQLQNNAILDKIKKTIVKKSLELLSGLTDEQWNVFYSQFSKNVKLGAYQDDSLRERLIKIMRYDSLLSNSKKISFEKYVDEMIHCNSELEDYEQQDKIYYIVGENRESLWMSPCVEKCKDAGINVLFMTDPIDEYMMQKVKTYTHPNGTTYEFVCMSKEGVVLPTKYDPVKEEDLTFCDELKTMLDGRIDDVIVTTRVTDSPCCVVTGNEGWSANMERMFKTQALRIDNGISDMMKSRRILEINPSHPLIKKMKKSDDEMYSEKITMLETAFLASGFAVQNTCGLANRFFHLLTNAHCGDD